MSMDTFDAWLLLNASGLTPRRQLALVQHFGGPEAVFAASDDELLSVEGITRRHVTELRAAQQKVPVARLRQECEEYEVRAVAIGEPEYPPLLREIADPPPMLFVQGQLDTRDHLAVAMVGTRRATPYGLRIAKRLAGDLAKRGFTVVSGMAEGIDGEAHRGALEAGGRTIAVMASGADITYPSSHRELRSQIAGAGAVVTEYAFGTAPLRERFPARNRIISGIAMGVVVVEAPDQSGALITARLGAEQGREVFAIPGDINSPTSRGCHRLIKDGVQLAEFAEDIVEGLGIMLQTVPQREQREAPELIGDEKLIYEALSFTPADVDALAEATGLAAANVTAALMLLEVKSLAQRNPGGTFVRMS